MSALLKSHSVPTHRPRLYVVSEPAVQAATVSLATYQRRRFMALFIAALTVFTVWYAAQSFLGFIGDAGGESMQTISATSPITESASGEQVITVRPGDTLWSIAQAAHPKGDFRPVLNQLAERYADTPLVPGMQIVVS